ncbi:MAG: hypothetical protein KKB38_20540 [Gammaproteobacteria bacterium]|nr:hypothetical protein [Gammaproteobacteria bacterium]
MKLFEITDKTEFHKRALEHHNDIDQSVNEMLMKTVAGRIMTLMETTGMSGAQFEATKSFVQAICSDAYFSLSDSLTDLRNFHITDPAEVEKLLEVRAVPDQQNP